MACPHYDATHPWKWCPEHGTSCHALQPRGPLGRRIAAIQATPLSVHKGSRWHAHPRLHEDDRVIARDHMGRDARPGGWLRNRADGTLPAKVLDR